MYTQCPDCNEFFRVTAEILQQAAGRVRCGACGHVFDALDGLSEVPPIAGGPPARGDDAAVATGLDEIDADDVYIEDTGVEWRVVDAQGKTASEDDDASDDADASALRWYIHEETNEPGNDARIPESAAARRQPSLALGSAEGGEERYDDNTPLPGLADDDDDEEAFPLAEPPRRRAEDLLEPRSPELEERQVDLALGDPQEWTDLLEEVGEEEVPDTAPPAEDEPTGEHPGIHPALSVPGEAHDARPGLVAEDDRAPLALVDDDDDDDEGTRPVAAETADGGATPMASGDARPGDDGAALELVDDDGSTGTPAKDDPGELERPDAPASPARGDAKARERQIDEELLRASRRLQDLGASGSHAADQAPPPHVETIIMEGDLVRSSLHGELIISGANEEMPPAAPAEAAGAEGPSLRDTYARLRDALPALQEAARPRRPLAVAAALLLGVLLAAQIVHAHRGTLATWPVFADTVGVLYSRLGAPIIPDWNINGWQFETTSGGTDASDRILTISASIANRTEHAMPYPLLHVGLTDRYEEIISGELLTPEQYLELRSAEGMVGAGDRFTATVTIAPVTPEVSGYKLNVCYPLTGTRVRCATGAFRNN